MGIKAEVKTTNWSKVDAALRAQVFEILYPDIDPVVFNFTQTQISIMCEKQAGKLSPEEIIANYNERQTKRAAALPAEFTALSFPDGIQDVLNRLGTRVVVSEKYPDTTAGRIKAVTDLKMRLARVKPPLTLEQAKALPIKEKATRTGVSRFVVVPFAVDDAAAVPAWVGTVLSALSALDPSIKFGKRLGAKAGVIVRLPAISGKLNILLTLPSEYIVPVADEA